MAAVRGYGGEVHLVEGSYEEAAKEAAGFAEREGKTLVPPFDDLEVVAGAGTVGLEIARQAPATRLVVVPLGGGGLASGVAIAIKSRLPGAKVVGVQAEACAPYVESLAAHRPIGTRSASTICDGIAMKQPGELTLPLVERHLDAVATVSDDQVAEAMVLLLERSKLVVEGAGAVGVAALLAGKVEPPAEGDICVVLSGGNVDASRLAECIRLGETAAGRRIVLWTVVPDRPGALAALLRLVAEHGANVMDVEHIREGVELHVRETAIELVLQTDGPDHSKRILEAVRAEGFRARLRALRGRQVRIGRRVRPDKFPACRASSISCGRSSPRSATSVGRGRFWTGTSGPRCPRAGRGPRRAAGDAGADSPPASDLRRARPAGR